MDKECVCGGWEYQAFSQGKTGLCQCPPIKIEQVNHPNHYGGENNEYEAIKVIDAWDLDFCLGNTVKYISRAGKKNTDKELEDLKKAFWYLQHKINTLEKK
jgi:hypothetical protein